MRSRGTGLEMRASTHQYHPDHFVYSTDTHWHCGTRQDIINRLHSLMPPAARDGLRLALSGASRQREEEEEEEELAYV